MLIEKHEYEVLKRENLSSEAARGHQDEDTNR